MERQELIERINNLDTIEDLLDLLNDLKQEDLGENAYPFTIEQIRRYRNPNITHRRYHKFDIPKKSGKSPRHITAPNCTLKSILTYVNLILQAMYEPLPCVMGFTQGRSAVDNASVHTGKNYVFNIDLKDFFPNVNQARIWKKLQCPPFNFRDDKTKGIRRRALADVIAGLCCMKDTDLSHPWVQKAPNPDKVYVLPQGAPTSPILTNIICERLDWLLTAVAHRFGAAYTRYADDITFSSMHNVYQADGEFIKEVRRIIEEQGFEINWDKVRLCKRDNRQEVTGLTVNEKPNVTRKYIQELRHILHEWEVKGYHRAYLDFLKHYRVEKGHIKKGDPAFENVLSGKLEYLKMVKGQKDPTYLRLHQRFITLTQRESQNKLDLEDSSFRYIVTYPVAVFNDAFGQIQHAVSRTGEPYLFFELNGKKEFIAFKKGLDITNLEKFIVSQCESKENGKRFYLLHRLLDPERFITKKDKNDIDKNQTGENDKKPKIQQKSKESQIKQNAKKFNKANEKGKTGKTDKTDNTTKSEQIVQNPLEIKLHQLVESEFDLKILLDNGIQ